MFSGFAGRNGKWKFFISIVRPWEGKRSIDPVVADHARYCKTVSAHPVDRDHTSLTAREQHPEFSRRVRTLALAGCFWQSTLAQCSPPGCWMNADSTARGGRRARDGVVRERTIVTLESMASGIWKGDASLRLVAFS